MSTISRALIGVGSIGGVVGGGFLANHYLSSDNIQSKLEANEFKLLGDNEQVWNDILTNYKLVVANTENKFKFESFDGTGDTAIALTTLKQKCKDIVAKKISEDKDNNLFEKAKKWCISPISVSELLKRDGYSPLNTKADDPKVDEDLWKAKIAEHKNEKSTKKKITGLDIKKETTHDAANLTNIKKKCEVIGKSNNYIEKFEEYLENYKDWCSNKK